MRTRLSLLTRTVQRFLVVPLLLLAAGCCSTGKGPESGSEAKAPAPSPATTAAVRPATPTAVNNANAGSGANTTAAAPGVSTAPAAPAASKPKPVPYEAVPELEGVGWEYLFDGKTLDGWKVTGFAGHGEVEVADGAIRLGSGAMLTGVNGLVKLPGNNYELALDAMKIEGGDFFCGLTFPVGTNCCTLVIGGWGGGVVGISSIEGSDASGNETTRYLEFAQNKWYRVRVKVSGTKVEAWIGASKIVDLDTTDKRISMRAGEIELNQPFGVAAWQTTAALKNIQWRKL